MLFKFGIVGLFISAVSAAASLPVVDLGYERYQATLYNETTDSYLFKNIRYAAPPTGSRRFEPPHPPLRNRSAIQTGAIGNTCFQALPLWSVQRQYPASQASFILQALSLQGSEDCLFLDLQVPRAIFDGTSSSKAAVLVWVYGGGYTAGYKDSYDGDGLVDTGKDHMIFVAMNYRLGAFGWMNSPSYVASGGTANLGLYDQRFAMEWVQKYISKFGGNKRNVTVVGESAGGGSIMHQITAYGGAKGNGTSPFQRAVPQSPGWIPTANKFDLEEVYVDVLKNAGCLSNRKSTVMGYGDVDDGLLCLKNLTSREMQAVNTKIVGNATYGGFVFGPTVDGTFVPDVPGVLLAQGAFDHNLTLMVGHNTNEGASFVATTINSTSDVTRYFTGAFKAAPSSVLNFVQHRLYPSPSNSTPYKTQFERASLLVSEGIFTCNTGYLARAFSNKTFNYLFSIPPGRHGQDIPYTFYVPGENATAAGVQNITVAQLLQRYLTNFVISGDPNKGVNTPLPTFPQYSNTSNVLNFNTTNFKAIHDPADTYRCSWWQKALYL